MVKKNGGGEIFNKSIINVICFIKIAFLLFYLNEEINTKILIKNKTY